PALIAAFVGAAKAGERERLRAAQRWISRGTHIKLLFKFDGVPPPSGFTENEARRLPGWSGLRRSGDIGGPRGHGLTRLVALERAHWKRGQPVRDLARQPHALAADDARARERAVPHPQPDRRVGHARDRDDLVLAEQPHDAGRGEQRGGVGAGSGYLHRRWSFGLLVLLDLGHRASCVRMPSERTNEKEARPARCAGWTCGLRHSAGRLSYASAGLICRLRKQPGLSALAPFAGSSSGSGFDSARAGSRLQSGAISQTRPACVSFVAV